MDESILSERASGRSSGPHPLFEQRSQYQVQKSLNRMRASP